MVESELGEIPKGWKVKNLGEMLELVYGKGLREGDRQEGQYPVYGSSGVVGNHIQFLVKAPGIVVGRKGNVGSIFWVDNNFFPIDTTYYVRTNQSMYFAYFALQLCNLSNSDSAVPGLSRGQAYMNPLISPEESILSKYDDIAKPIFNQKKKLKEEIETLSQIRDSLLPRLMSGKLRVPKKGELNG
jgi:type I restriction enzyme S subunit